MSALNMPKDHVVEFSKRSDLAWLAIVAVDYDGAAPDDDMSHTIGRWKRFAGDIKDACHSGHRRELPRVGQGSSRCS